MLRMLLLAFVLAFGVSTKAIAQELPESESESIARAYMAVYSAADWGDMAAYMSDDFMLIDRTNPDPSFAPEYHGRDATLEMLRAFGRDQGVIELGALISAVFINSDPGAVSLKWLDRSLVLRKVPSGSGAKYSGKSTDGQLELLDPRRGIDAHPTRQARHEMRRGTDRLDSRVGSGRLGHLAKCSRPAAS